MNESSQRTKISRILSCLEQKFRSDSDNVFLIYRSKTVDKNSKNPFKKPY